MIDFPAIGQWREGQVAGTWTESSQPVIPEVEQAIEAAWIAASSRPGVHLFNGPMCRLESFHVSPQTLHLTLSPSDYKTFVGTNLANPTLGDRFGPAALANAVGLSTSVLSSDGFVLLGRRSERVNYYPSRIHPFSGSLEPGETIDVFAEIRRELHEELSLGAGEIESIVCLGIAVDRSIRQPEVMFATRTRLDRAALQERLELTEHVGIWSTPMKADSILPAAAQVAQFTPIGIAALLLTGRSVFGEAWFGAGKAVFVND